VVLAALVYHLAWVPYRAGSHFYRAETAKDKAEAVTAVTRALDLEPHNNMYLHFSAMARLPEDPVRAWMHMAGTIWHNDGQKVAWTVWDQFARLALANGAVYLADAAFGKAIWLNPAYTEAYQGLAYARKQIRIIEEACVESEKKEAA
jgi:predicted Zn-dependent protease